MKNVGMFSSWIEYFHCCSRFIHSIADSGFPFYAHVVQSFPFFCISNSINDAFSSVLSVCNVLCDRCWWEQWMVICLKMFCSSCSVIKNLILIFCSFLYSFFPSHFCITWCAYKRTNQWAGSILHNPINSEYVAAITDYIVYLMDFSRHLNLAF